MQTLLTKRLISGIIRRLVGKATAKPISQPPTNLCANIGAHPVLTSVIVKDIVVSKTRAIKSAVRTPEYFALNFKVITLVWLS